MLEKFTLEMIAKASETLPEALRREFSERLKKQAYQSSKKKKRQKGKVSKEHLEEVRKGFINGTAEAGTHFHALVRNELKTRVDGRHKHGFLFRGKDNEVFLLFTELDGEHWHTMNDVTDKETGADVSEHKHVVRIPFDMVHESGIELKEGTVLISDMGGKHPHGADMLETTNFDGAHPHVLDIGVDSVGNRVSISTVDIAEFWDLFGPFDMSAIGEGEPSSIAISRAADMTLRPIRKEAEFKGTVLKEAAEEDVTDEMRLMAAAFGQTPITEEDVVCKQSDVIEILFDKKLFPTQTEVKQKASELNYPELLSIGNEENQFRARVARPSAFEVETKNVKIESGVFAVVGTRKKKVEKEDFISEDHDAVLKEGEINSLMFPKEHFTEDQVKQFIRKTRQFKAKRIDSNDDFFYVQKSDMVDVERIKTVTLKDSGGVKAMMAVRKEDLDCLFPDKDLDETDEDLAYLAEERSDVFGIPVLKEWNRFVEGTFAEYGDPVNFMFPMKDAESVMKSIDNFAEESVKLYENDKVAKATVYERLVSKALDMGVEVNLDPADETDRLLSNVVFKEAEAVKKNAEINPPWFDKGATKEQKQRVEKLLETCPEELPIMKADDEKRLVTALVLEPDVFDAQDDTSTAEDIERAAHFYMINGRVIGFRHKTKADAQLVESFIAKSAFTIDGPNGKQKVKKGTWLVVIKVNDDKLWADIKSGKINGVSVGGFGQRVAV